MSERNSWNWEKVLSFKKNLYLKQDRKCFYCRIKKKDYTEMHLEHFLPKCKGGGDEEKNFVLSCIQCNLSKNGKINEEWLKRSIFLMEEYKEKYINKRKLVRNLENMLKIIRKLNNV